MLETLTIIIGGICTLGIYTYLIKENPVYSFFEHLFIGIATGFGLVYTLKNFLYPQIIVPMLGLDIMIFPDGTASKEYNPRYLLYLLPMSFGLLYYFIFSKRNAWLAKLVIGFTLGASGGFAIKGFFNAYYPQIISSFKPLAVFENGQLLISESINNFIFILVLFLTLYYFFFTFRQDSRGAKKLQSSGRLLMMVCFGAFFGSTVMARMALLVERMQFLIMDWLPALGDLL